MIVQKFLVYSFLLLFIANCTKIDTTTVGQDLIPPVDGVSTFSTDTFSIETENGLFNDTSKVFKSDDHIIGNLQNNTDFGSTNASIYLQYSPFSKFKWLAAKDSIAAVNQGSTSQGYDSSFICLGLVSRSLGNVFYGDTTSDLVFDVYRITAASNFVKDSTYRIAQAPGGVVDDGVLIGTKTIKPQDLKKYNVIKVKGFTDSINNQIRIKLNANGDAWVKNNLLLKDSFSDRTEYTLNNKGFVVKVRQLGSPNNNCMIRVSLASNATRMEVFYKYIKNAAVDTASQFFYFNPSYNSDWGTAQANFINRNITGSNLVNATAPGIDNTLYLESTPGSFVKVKIPFMKNFPNKMIHRAELVIQEIGNQNNTFYSPTQMFLDCFDTSTVIPQRYVSVPFDYYLTNNATADFNYFGGDRRNRTNTVIGGLHSNYVFNLTKYFQNMITRNHTKYDFRLYVPFDTRYYSQAKGYQSNFLPTFENLVWPLVNTPTFGRVIVGGGNHPQYKMKLRVIYSNL